MWYSELMVQGTRYDLGTKMIDALSDWKVLAGDVVSKLGRSFARSILNLLL